LSRLADRLRALVRSACLAKNNYDERRVLYFSAELAF